MSEEYMKNCDKCKRKFHESKLDISHDVPKYLFLVKKDADKWGRRYLCKSCHDKYEKILFSILIKSLPLKDREKLKGVAKSFAKSYF